MKQYVVTICTKPGNRTIEADGFYFDKNFTLFYKEGTFSKQMVAAFNCEVVEGIVESKKEIA
jgi:hypothetical protein